jgi:hypothetical protein
MLSLEAGWRLLGDARFGLQVGVPEDWIDATSQVRTPEMIGRFGPQMILLTDSGVTADRLLAGDPPGQGGFVFGFAAEPAPPGSEPDEALSELLSSSEVEGVLPITPESTVIGRYPAASVDLAYDPLDVFIASPEPMQYRVLLVSNSELNSSAVFVIGSSAESWNNQADVYNSISELVNLAQTKANIFGHLVSGELVQGTLTESLDNIWTFTVNGGDYATITATPEEENVDLTVTLIDPQGNVVLTKDDGYAGELETISDVLLQESGTYVVEASEFFNESGRYRLSLLLSDEPHFDSGGRIEFGQEITAELLPDSKHFWTFDGVAGQSATIILSSLDEKFDVILELRSPEDRPIIVLDEGFAGDAEVLTGLELPVTGEYTIAVRGFAGHGGIYMLTLDEGGESTANFFDVGDLIYGDRRQGTLRKDEAHAWFFTGEAGNEVSIAVAPLEATMDMDVWLLGPELQELVMSDEYLSGEPERFQYMLPEDGQYLILVREFFGEPGGYDVTLNAGGVDALEIAGRIVYSETVRGTLRTGQREGWSFAGEADDVIDVLLTPLEQDRDLVLLLVDPAGKTAITVDAAVANNPERLVAFKLTESGQWTIVVKEFFNEGGEYELLISKRDLENQQPE